MIFIALMLAVLMLLWAALGFHGLSNRSSEFAQIAFVTTILIAVGAYSVAQAMAR